MGDPSVSDRVEDRLAPLLGRNMARTAIRQCARQALGCEPEALASADLPRLAVALRPALRTLLGATAAERVLHELCEGIR